MVKMNGYLNMVNIVVYLGILSANVLTGLMFSEPSEFTETTVPVNSLSACSISSPVALGFSSRY